MRYNPPPNWPAPPPGWAPGADWAPDPLWPQPPPGWQFWVEDSAPGLSRQAKQRGSRLSGTALIAVAAVLVVVVAGVVAAVVLTRGDNGSQAGLNPTAARTPVTLPFGGNGKEQFYPEDVSVDTHGNIYVTAVNDGVLKLAKGASTPTRIPFSGLSFAVSGAADDAGNVYVTDDGNSGKGRVQKLTPGGTQTELPFSDLGQDPNLAVASDGTIYIADGSNNRVLKLSAGATSSTELPFTGLKDPRFVTVDSTGTVYVSDRDNSRVVTLASGSTSQQILPFTVNGIQGVAVDRSGNVYGAGPDGVTVFVKDSGKTTQLPLQGVSKPLGMAVDADGNIYITDGDSNQVIELKS